MILGSSHTRRALQISNNLLVASLSIFLWRDVWPLATFTQQPKDHSPFLYCRGLLLVLVAAIIPLATPTSYFPVDSKQLNPVPVPEQTASPLSFMFFTFVDPLVWLGYRSEHLAPAMLPPVADYDQAKYWNKRAAPKLDPLLNKGSGKLLLRLVVLFRLDVLALGCCIILRVVTSFGSPVGLNRLLMYLESGGQDAVVRPWVWIALLFLDPMLQSISMQWYFWRASRLLVRIEVVITQLVFAHALRLPKTNAHVQSDEDPDVEVEANFVGKIQNLVTSDLANITTAKDSLFLFLNFPLQVVFCIWFLYALLGWSSIVGLIVMLIYFPLPGWIATRLNRFSVQMMKATDGRVQQMTEVLNVLRMVKMFSWQSRMKDRLSESRETELKWMRLVKLTYLVNDNLTPLIPILSMISTYATFTLVMQQELTASIVFSSMLLFDMLRSQLETASAWLPLVIAAKVSISRLSEFLYETRPLDHIVSPAAHAAPAQHASDVAIHNASFTWSTRPQPTAFHLTVRGTLAFQRGALNLVVGPTASGKSSLLLALLGEMHLAPLNIEDASWFNVPRARGVAFSGQDSWVENRTIRDNILFDQEYDERRYRKTLHQCALEQDLALFGAGDLTEVGEKGITLSGGQRARIALARAVYSSAPVVLLDDPLSALDAHTARWIIKECFEGDLLHGRTVILATHNVGLVSRLAGRVVVLEQGRASVTEDFGTVVKEHPEIVQESTPAVGDDSKETNANEQAGSESQESGKIVVAEDVAVGRVEWPAIELYLHSFGGWVFWTVCFTSLFGAQFIKIMQTWFLGYWSSLYETQLHVPVAKLLVQYSLLLLLGVAVSSVAFALFVGGSIKASREIHARLVASILQSTFRWLDVTPSSRILSRCTSDIRSVDSTITMLLHNVTEYSTSLLFKFVAVVIFSPIFAIPGAVIFGTGWKLGRIYMKAQMPVKRETSNARAPVLANFGTAINGMVTIRAYGAQQRFKDTLVENLDNYTRCVRAMDNLSRWICIRIHGLGGLFAASFAAFLVYGGPALGHRQYSTSDIGFSLSLAISFAGMTLAWVLLSNMLEVEANSLERIQTFLAIDQEPASSDRGIPPAYWPSTGELHAEGFSARYSKDGPLVLRDLSFNIKSGERIGIVGRTGSGKSTLALSLLRCIPTTGNLRWDGRDTNPQKTNLDALRANMTVIPQQPALLTGTLRSNLDPFETLEDVALHDVLRAVGLPLSLDAQIESGGENLSLGERQMVAIARAILRRSKVVILDEATAAIDHKADLAIQHALRQELHGVTLLTIAHRLRTIADYDRVMVLQEGQLVEFDTPAILFANEESLFHRLVQQSHDKDELAALLRTT
ncbi:P-loop containing nucleoside triphosphate hydrolase protein [Auriculariales sp. MPI-PUGE-AT-0066]|nr:P-loop containing nucleoside triphosphate hydrolase protein [Auriculariales sp. MPI-PUGE-AT-0066]